MVAVCTMEPKLAGGFAVLQSGIKYYRMPIEICDAYEFTVIRLYTRAIFK